jgi:hypothetical protein
MQTMNPGYKTRCGDATGGAAGTWFSRHIRRRGATNLRFATLLLSRSFPASWAAGLLI